MDRHPYRGDRRTNIFSIRWAIRLIEGSVGCSQMARFVERFPRRRMLREFPHESLHEVARDIHNAPDGTQVRLHQRER